MATQKKTFSSRKNNRKLCFVMLRKFINKYFEILFWITALTLPAIMSPGNSTHYSLCIFKLLGIDFCPGCGLAHSISFLFHGDIYSSFKAHPFGIFAVLIILKRIFNLLQIKIITPPENYYAIQKQ